MYGQAVIVKMTDVSSDGRPLLLLDDYTITETWQLQQTVNENR